MSDENIPEVEQQDNSKAVDELSDNELDNVAGGDGTTPTPRPHVSEFVITKKIDVASPNFYQ